MLQQTQVATVIGYYLRWLERFPTAAALAEAPEEEVLSLWQGLGYYSRARNLHRAAKEIARSGFPKEEGGIRTLPGVGPYTAAAVATFAFDAPAVPLDGNIARVLARLLDYREPIDTAAGLAYLREAATRWQPATGAGLYNEAMMELGALLCTPRTPACTACPVAPFCAAPEPASLPLKKPRPKTIRLEEVCGWVVERGRILLEQQTGRRWRGLWRLPLLAGEARGACLATREYPFTNHRITLRVYHAGAQEVAHPCEWHPLGSLPTLAMPAPHRRVVEALLPV